MSDKKSQKICSFCGKTIRKNQKTLFFSLGRPSKRGIEKKTYHKDCWKESRRKRYK